MVGLAIGLFVCGLAVGGFLENSRLHGLYIKEQKKREEQLPLAEEIYEDPLIDILHTQTNELQHQNKKLDTLIMQQALALDAPEVTQEMPMMSPHVTQELPVIEN